MAKKNSPGSVRATGQAANALFAARTMTPEQREAADLCASPKACAVADVWQALRNDDSENAAVLLHTPVGREEHLTGPLEDALNVLELATRESPLRKVKP